jgi:ABC-type transport system substrate-binding protein
MRRDHAIVDLFAALVGLLTACTGEGTGASDAPSRADRLRIAAPQPWLVTAVRQVDPFTWELDLRQGGRWHDGQPFTVKDVTFTFDYMKMTPTGRWTHHVTTIPTISTVTAVDPDTVRFTYPHPDAPFANPSLSNPFAPEESRQLLDQVGVLDRDGDEVREGPNGPLRFQVFVTANLPIDVRAAELVAEDLRKVGIELRVTGVDAAAVANLPLYYPDEYWAFRAGSYGGWVGSPGYGIVQKWSRCRLTSLAMPVPSGRNVDGLAAAVAVSPGAVRAGALGCHVDQLRAAVSRAGRPRRIPLRRPARRAPLPARARGAAHHPRPGARLARVSDDHGLLTLG